MRPIVRLLGYLRPYALRMVAATLLLLVAGGMMAAVLATLKPLVNEVLLARPPAVAASPARVAPDILGIVRPWLPKAGWSAWLRERAFVEVPLLMVLIFVLRGICLYFGRYLISRCGVSVIRRLRLELYEAVTFQSMSFFRANPTGTIQSRVLADVQRLQRVSTEVLTDLLRVGSMVPVLLILIVIHDWRVPLFASVALPLLVVPMVRLGRRQRKVSRRSQESLADAASLLNETVTGIKVVQGFAMERFEIDRFRAVLDRQLSADLKSARAAALAPPVMEMVAALAGAALFYFAGLNIAHGKLDPGDFAVVLSGLGLLFMSMRRLNQVNQEMQKALAAGERVFEILDRERAVCDAPGARALTTFERQIRLEGVDFAYGEETILSDIELEIRKGEKIALVGPSGAGKTTLVQLLLRFYDPTAGAIRIDGQDLRHLTLDSLRASIGLVTQDTVLFDDTVYNNIAYGRADIARERVEAAARAAHAHGFISGLPDAYDTRLGEHGARLSTGQRQRIAIARALVKDAPILILDEATSALDAESEQLVGAALENLLRGRTGIMIAHRLDTTRRADRILVLDKGSIVEQGSHQQLLARGGLYCRLYEIQSSARETSGVLGPHG